MSQVPPMAICPPSVGCKLSYRADVILSQDQGCIPAARVCTVSTGWSQSLPNNDLPKRHNILSLYAIIKLHCAVCTACLWNILLSMLGLWVLPHNRSISSLPLTGRGVGGWGGNQESLHGVMLLLKVGCRRFP